MTNLIEPGRCRICGQNIYSTSNMCLTCYRIQQEEESVDRLSRLLSGPVLLEDYAPGKEHSRMLGAGGEPWATVEEKGEGVFQVKHMTDHLRTYNIFGEQGIYACSCGGTVGVSRNNLTSRGYNREPQLCQHIKAVQKYLTDRDKPKPPKPEGRVVNSKSRMETFNDLEEDTF